MRFLSAMVVSAALAASAWATTLQKLSTDDMIRQSTGIVRAKVTGSRAAFLGKDVYTYYQLQVTENLKGFSAMQLEVAVPGGGARGVRQMVPGAPVLASGQEYVVFLWTSRSGLTQVIGLSQGLFAVTQNSAGDSVIVRPAAVSMMLNQAGQVVADQPVSLSLSDLRSEIRSVLGAAK
jgi:hypothetical protein